MVTIEQVREVKKRYEKELLKKPGVIGCAIGYKYINGKKTDELCIICYVEEKIQKEKLKKQEIIPKKIEGISVDVIESGRMARLRIPWSRPD